VISICLGDVDKLVVVIQIECLCKAAAVHAVLVSTNLLF